MAIDPSLFYRDIVDYDAYFGDQLHADDWINATVENKEKAALAATRAVDNLHFKNVKKTVYDAIVAAGGEDGVEGDILYQNTDLTTKELRQAYESQLHQFPRDKQDADTVPDDIFYATAEEAISLLSGRFADQAFRNLVLTSGGVASNRVSMDRSGQAQKHIVHRLTSPYAWQLCEKWISRNHSFDIKRV